MTKQKYKICNKCVLDTSVLDIIFDNKGVCNYCKKFEDVAIPILTLDEKQKEENFSSIIKEIKRNGEGKDYDCILGISGGIDSSYLALLAKNNGLRTLLVHFDNGWNSELAVKNIEKIIDYCDFDLHTVVTDWEIFKNLQKAYFRASVVDIEVPTDHLIVGALYSIARKKNIKSILSGANVATEFIMPTNWNFSNKGDYTNLKKYF
jgi:3'-phosphoadenosine 5'-phosphosulfate sulfotransferase (PAPS reductase)/FAD synthetase